MELILLAVILTTAMGYTLLRLLRMTKNAEERCIESKRILSYFNTDTDLPEFHEMVLFHGTNGVVEYDIALG